MTAIFFPLAALLVDILIIIIFFSKKNISNKETKIYSYLLIVNFIECAFNVIGITYVILHGNLTVFSVLQKIDMVMIIMWACLMFFYVYNVSGFNNKKYNILKKIGFATAWIASILTLCLPCTPIIEGESINSIGLSPDCAYITVALFAIGIILCVISAIIRDKDNIKNRKYYPLYALILLAIVGLILRSQIPSVIFEPFVMGYVVLIMYHTIENPDVKMIEQLNIAKDQADKANRAKTDFLSSMSHEIRTPLNAIVGFSECIKQSKTLDEAQDNADDIISASNTLLEIVNGILDISKIEAGKIEIHNSSYNSKELFDSIVKLGRGRLGEKPLEFRVNIAPDIPETLYGDHANVKKVIINILTNAIKYTDKGFVDLSVKCVNTNDICRLIISVEDSGRGIKEKDIDKLFTKFQRLEEDRNTTIEGTGLGLAITKQLVDLMGGKIVVNSTFGEGSKFTIALDQKISETKVEKAEIKEFNDLDLTNKKILVVDDNKLNLKVATKILEKYKPTIETVESGMECLDKINSGNKYDLILMDDMMPRMSGGETLLRLKQIENFNTPVVVLTANAISGMEEKYKKEGFNDYLAKPIDKDKLHTILIKYLKNESSINVEEKHVEEPVIEKKEDNSVNDINVFDLTGKRVLIVDDNKLNIKVATTFLKQYNPDIDEALSGDECIEKIKNGNKYDLIFMDDMMPNKSGVETFHELEKISGFNIPVVALTANAIDGMKEQYLTEGFDEYLSKPINKNELNRILKFLFLKDSNTKEIKIEDAKIDKIIEDSKENNKSKFGELPEYLFEINDNKSEAYKEKIETPKQFSSVYITKENNKNNIDYLKQNGIDIDNGLELLGDIDMYNDTLKEFLNNINERINKLKTFKEQKDMNNYAIEAHALKSDSRYLGFKELSGKALEHEMKSKENDIEYVNNDFDNLINSINKIISITKEYI
ncbi:MAG: response regulator [Bacilli bacterium]|nr:response regulator [Bacilli bacterium]